MAKLSNASVKIGDIFYDSWGYDQTNIDFYQVVGLRGKSSVELRAIHSLHEPDGYMSEKVRPDVGNFKLGKGYKTRLIDSNEESIVRRVREYAPGDVWAGSECLRLCGPDKELVATHYA